MFDRSKLESLRDVRVTGIGDTLSDGFPQTVYTITNTHRIRIYPGKLDFGFRTFTLQRCQKTNNLQSLSYNWEFIRTPLFTRVQTRSVSKFVQLCCEFTRVNVFTLWHKRIETYLAKYLSTFFSGLIFLRTDPHRILFLPIASERIKLIRTNIYTFYQFTRVNLHGVNGAPMTALARYMQLHV